jgi:hypothetical protein
MSKVHMPDHFDEDPAPFQPPDGCWDGTVMCSACGHICDLGDLLMGFSHGRFIAVCPNPTCPTANQ